MTPEILIKDDNLEIQWLQGRSDRLVVSFTGIGRKSTPKVSGIEFPKISWQDGKNSVLFVIDRNRSWYNREGLADRITEVVVDTARQHGLGDILTLGNSMGGYGAVLFANRVGANKAISFAPQFTMNDDVLRDSRWQTYKQQMTGFTVNSLAECMDSPAQFIVLHGGRGQDRKHYLRFPTGPNISHFIVPRRTHAVATHLRTAGSLAPLIDALMEGDFKTSDLLIAREGAHLRDPSRRGEAMHLWAAARKTLPGHRLANWIVTRMLGKGGVIEH